MSTAVDSHAERERDSMAEAILPDLATCEDCRQDLLDTANRRYRYPFIHCPCCGPRSSILRAMPFRRAHTTFEAFPPCARCRDERQSEGRQTGNEIIVCPDCGPRVEARDTDGVPLATGDDAVRASVAALRGGAVVAVKDVGGYHLFSDVRCDSATHQLLRPSGRLVTLLFLDLDAVLACFEASELERAALTSPAAPIVRLRRCTRHVVRLPSNFGSPRFGVALAGNGLQILLLHELGSPLIMTHGTEMGHAVCTDDDEASQSFGELARVFLSHDLSVARPLPDSIVQEVAGRIRTLRCGRGTAPLRLPLGQAGGSHRILAVGSHRDASVAVVRDAEAILSQHIGDLDTLPAFETFRRVVDQLTEPAEAAPDRVVRDLHRDYMSSNYAESSGLSVERCQHHVAHVVACLAEHGVNGPAVGVAWDGNGLGADDRLWGGELIRIKNGGYERLAHFRSFRLPGGEAATREPRRAALGVLYEFLGHKMFGVDWLNPMKACTERELHVLSTMLHRGFNSPFTSSVGRLFDAVASLAGVRQVSAFENQAFHDLEEVLQDVRTDVAYPFEVDSSQGEPWIVDWEPTIREVVRDVNRKVALGKISAKFHNTMAEIVVELALRAGEGDVGLSGGCFRNRYLTERTVTRLREKGFRVHLHERIPPGDGGVALGQAVWATRSEV